MSINREIWLEEKFNSKNNPNWKCPTCAIGNLNLPKDLHVKELSAGSKNEHPQYLSQFPEEEEKRIAGILRCSNSKCKESVSFCGKIEIHWVHDEFNYTNKRVSFYKPIYVYPPIQIFPLSENCPKDVQDQIIKSFSHFFSDYAASANSMRIALEIVLNKQKIRKTYINKHGERNTYSLHQRIDLFGKEYPELKPYVLAAKWIGNAGSHFGEINREDLLDGYELLEHTIDELYDKKLRENKLKAKAKSINKRKKPESTRKTK